MHRIEFGSPTLSKQDVVSKSPFLVLKVHRIFIQFHNVSTFYCKNITYRLRNNIASTPFLSLISLKKKVAVKLTPQVYVPRIIFTLGLHSNAGCYYISPR